MAKKKRVRTNPEATFEVRFVATGLAPEKIPFRAVSKALSAVQDLASGRDPFEEQQVPEEKTIGLIDVLRGSAVYRCISRAPEEAVENLSRVGILLASFDEENGHEEELVNALRPIQSLSEIAGTVGCDVQVRLLGRDRKPLFCIAKDDYQRLSGRLFVRGETTIIGTIKRVGGATGMRCLLRVAGRRRILYCNVCSTDLVRRLGQHLYEEIAATGTATWIHRSWRIHEFTINDFAQPTIGRIPDAIKELRDAGLRAWDDIDDPEKYIQELR